MSKGLLDHPILKERRKLISETLEAIGEKGFAPEGFCLMPFVNIILEPTGDVGFCRHKGTEFTFGNIREKSIEEIWNGEEVIKWRREFLEGKPTICQREVKEQGCNLCPELNKMLPSATLEEKPSFPPLRLTANLNGLCNLECQMCHVWRLPNDRYNEENFWGPARKTIFPYLEEIDMLSGEPLIQQDTFKLIDEVSLVNKDCLWSITTNAHWKLGPKMREALDRIKIKNLILSVDSFIPEIYAKIRKKGSLAVVLGTVEDLLVYEQERISKGLSGLRMNLNFLIQKDNWKEAKEAIDFCLNKNIHPFLTFCYEPIDYSLLDLTQERREEILNFYLKLDWDYLSLMRRITTPLIESLPTVLKKKYYLSLLERKKEFESR